MGTNRIDLNKQYNSFRKKRTLFLFFLVLSIVVAGVIYFFLKSINASVDTITTVFLVLVIIYFILFNVFRNRVVYNNMKLEYYRMLLDDLKPIKLQKAIFTDKWFQGFILDGFTKNVENNNFIILTKFSDRTNEFIKTNNVMETIVIAKNENADFYSDEVDNLMKGILEKTKSEKKYRKRTCLQFKKYDSYNDKVKTTVDQIINFNHSKDYLIHITVGYFVKENSVYFLRPAKRYPNKMYYYAICKIKKYCNIEVGDLK